MLSASLADILIQHVWSVYLIPRMGGSDGITTHAAGERSRTSQLRRESRTAWRMFVDHTRGKMCFYSYYSLLQLHLNSV